MATPTRSQGVSTPRNPLTSTPNRPTASPRPNTSHLQNKSFAQKSPTAKTPASSGYSAGHSQRFSVSSQPTSTPIAAPAIHDELLNLNSPAAALIASIGGNTGLTPLPISSTQDGLGITTGITSAAGLQDTIAATAGAMASVVMPRNPEMERLHRLQEVARLLDTRSLGRGVTRKGVAALAQRNKFDQQWDGNQVNIAGNSVDLEMTFELPEHGGRPDVVRDVTLNLVTDDSGDPQPQTSASAMLKRQLVLGDDQRSRSAAHGQPWRDLSDFSTNLNYLSHHDQLPCPTNAFKLVGGLYDTFQKIWLEEKKRMKGRHEASHICQGNVGRPAMDVGKKLGLCSHYWAAKHEYLVAAVNDAEFNNSEPEMWLANFRLDVGEPAITSNLDWLAPEVLDSTVIPENVFQSNQAEKPKWQDTNGKDNGVSKREELDAMNLDEPNAGLPESLGVQFICDLEPFVLVPINVVTELNASSQMMSIQQAQMTTIQQALQSEVERLGSVALTGLSASRWTKTVTVFDNAGTESKHSHAYMLFTNGVAWCYPVTQLWFNHPRQFSEALPILRQYALLWSLLRTTVVDEDGRGVKPVPMNTGAATAPHPMPKEQTPTVKKRSNKKQARIELEQLLHPHSHKRNANSNNEPTALNIDISLDLISDTTRTKIDILIPTRDHSFIQASIAVLRNGIIEVVSIAGVLPSLSSSSSSSTTDQEKLKRDATRIISLSEDIGVLTQWLMRKYTSSKSKPREIHMDVDMG